jgi:hypothetical protein
MATYVNNLRLKEITTGDEDGTWGTSTNTNLELITDALGYGTKQFAADSNETFTIPDATADGARALYLKFTSAVSLTGTRTATLGPNTVSKMWMIENATTGGQSIAIKQGSGAEVTIGTGEKVFVYTDGAGTGAAVFNANPTEAGAGTVSSVDVSGGSTGLSYSGGPITSSGTITMAGTLVVANGGTGLTSLVNADIASATTVDLTSATGNVAVITGTVTTTAFTMTKGQQMVLIAAAAWPMTFNATTCNINGGASYTCAAGDRIYITKDDDDVIRVSVTKQDGTSVVTGGQPDPTLTGVGLTATEGQFIVATAGSITINLPASPSAGDFVIVKDGTGAAATTSFTVATTDGANIASSATNLTFDKNFAEITMTYINGSIGWSV